MDFNQLKKKFEKQHEGNVTHNLYERSLGSPASAYEWSNPEEADGVPILARLKVSDSDPNRKTAYDNFTTIMTTKAGYMGSQVTREFGVDIPEAVKDAYKEFDRLNNTSCLWKDLVSDVTGWGYTYTLCYLDADNNVRIEEYPAWQCSIVDGVGIIKTKEGDKEYAYIYDTENKYKYDFVSGSKLDEKPHGFGEMPLVCWKNNRQMRGNAQKAVGLLDAYDTLISDNVTEVSAVRSAYIVLKNAGTIDDETKESMKKTGIFALAGDASAEFLQKNVNPAHVELMIKEVWAGIWTVASSVDPKALSSLTSATAFQIKQMYRLMENDCQQTEKEFEKSLEMLDRILKSYWTKIASPSVPDFNTWDVNYVFKRNTPVDIMADLESMKRAGINLPQYKMIMLALGVDEETAKEYAEAGMEEMNAMLPDLTIGE